MTLEAFWLQYEHADTRGSLTSVRRPQFEPTFRVLQNVKQAHPTSSRRVFAIVHNAF